VLLFEQELGAGFGMLAPDLVHLGSLHVVEERVEQEELVVVGGVSHSASPYTQ
jgi:hypothetical protein